MELWPCFSNSFVFFFLHEYFCDGMYTSIVIRNACFYPRRSSTLFVTAEICRWFSLKLHDGEFTADDNLRHIVCWCTKCLPTCTCVSQSLMVNALRMLRCSSEQIYPDAFPPRDITLQAIPPRDITLHTLVGTTHPPWELNFPIQITRFFFYKNQ